MTAAEVRADRARQRLEATAHRVAIGADGTGALLTATEAYTEALLAVGDLDSTAEVAAFVAVAVMSGATTYAPVEAAPADEAACSRCGGAVEWRDCDQHPDDECYATVCRQSPDCGHIDRDCQPDDIERLRDILDRHPATAALADAMRDALARLDALDDDGIAAALGLDRHPNAQPDPDDTYDAAELDDRSPLE